MSILEQLKKEAEQKQKTEIQRVSVEEQLKQNYQQRILPKMQAAFHFMKELVEHLNFLEHAVTVANYSNRYPQMGALMQNDYKIYTDEFGGFADFNRLMQVNIRFFCVGDGRFSYNLEGKNRIEEEVAFLTARHVPFDWKIIEGTVGVQTACFTVTRRIPVRFRFEVDYQQSKIKLLINNHENFQIYQKTFDPEAVDDELFDEIARFMLRKDSDFIRLAISSTDREAIRELAEKANKEQAALLAQVNTEKPANGIADKSANVLSRFSKLVKR